MREMSTIANRPFLMAPPHMIELAAKMLNFRSSHENAANAQVSIRGVGVFGSVAVIPMVGPIFHRSSGFTEFFGFRSLQWFRAAMAEALGSPQVTHIVIDWASRGGEVSGTPEMAADLFAMRGSKPIISHANTMMASAAIWIGAQADQVIASPSADVGSVGVWVLHQNWSKFFEDIGIVNTFIFAGKNKVDGNPFEALSDEAHADILADVERIHAEFLGSVAKARGISMAAARKQFGDARVFDAQRAREVGLVDRVETMEDLLIRLNGGGGRARTRRRPRGDRFVLSGAQVRALDTYKGDGPDGGDTSAAATAWKAAKGILRSAIADVVHVAGQTPDDADQAQCCARCGCAVGDSDTERFTPGAVVTENQEGHFAISLVTLEPDCQAGMIDELFEHGDTALVERLRSGIAGRVAALPLADDDAADDPEDNPAGSVTEGTGDDADAEAANAAARDRDILRLRHSLTT